MFSPSLKKCHPQLSWLCGPSWKNGDLHCYWSCIVYHQDWLNHEWNGLDENTAYHYLVLLTLSHTKLNQSSLDPPPLPLKKKEVNNKEHIMTLYQAGDDFGSSFVVVHLNISLPSLMIIVIVVGIGCFLWWYKSLGSVFITLHHK